MFDISRFFLIASVLTCLASCGGGASNLAVTAGAPSPGGQGSSGQASLFASQSIASIFGAAGSGPITVGQIGSATEHLDLLLDVADENLVSIGRPADASVALSGLIGVGDQVEMVVGRLSLDANFTTNTVTGSTADFSIFSGATPETTVKIEDLSGSLAISSGVITGSSMVADLDGVLSGTQNVTYDAELRGSFLDVDGRPHAIGIFDGTTTVGSGSAQSFNDGTFLVSE